MSQTRNILFIMCDQLRADYLSCAGFGLPLTPNIDRLAARGVRFSRAYVQSPVCGPSRMSFYTGRTVFSHGATWNGVPLPLGEWTIADYLRPHGIRTTVIGKTHLIPDRQEMERLRIDGASEAGQWVADGGFELWGRDDGIHPDPKDPSAPARGGRASYNSWLRGQGYEGSNPWHDYANSALGPDGELCSGWQMRHSRLPARVPEEHSETAWATDEAINFIAEMGERPWCLHVSYIKPHWPYMAPAPYHAMFSSDDIPPAQRSESERHQAHPVYEAFMQADVSRAFAQDAVRHNVIPTYMGLVRQVDDHVGRLMEALERLGRSADTLIVFTSDHGDYLGDHWLGEKELFHEPSVRVPLILVDPAEEARRGVVEDGLVEAIDLLPTFLDALGISADRQRLEGRSLWPALRSGSDWQGRAHILSELDYAFYKVRTDLGLGPNEARCLMLHTGRWKYIHHMVFRPQLFDLDADPLELNDLGVLPAYDEKCSELRDLLLARLLTRRNRVTLPDAEVEHKTDASDSQGVYIGRW